QSDPGGQSPLAQEVAALQQEVATLQTTLNNETEARQAADAALEIAVGNEAAACQTAVGSEAAARQAGDAALQNQVVPLGAKLEKVSIQQIDGCYSIVIDGANLHLRNGLGATNGNPAQPFTSNDDLTHTNGLGNLIIGYNESLSHSPNRSGS